MEDISDSDEHSDTIMLVEEDTVLEVLSEIEEKILRFTMILSPDKILAVSIRVSRHQLGIIWAVLVTQKELYTAGGHTPGSRHRHNL